MTTQPDWQLRDCDRQLWEEQLDAFVPAKVFDAHCHIYNIDHVPQSTIDSFGSFFRDSTSYARLVDLSQQYFPNRELGFLTLGTPLKDTDVEKHVAYHASEVEGKPRTFANRLVTPACTVDEIRRDVEQHGFIGLKPYRTFSVTGDPNHCRIHEFLTHEQMELASELGLFVTMHLSRVAGVADEHNLADLTEYTTKRYPGIRWILAHCARSFTYKAIELAIDQLRDLPNIWYDTSAVTDLRPMVTLFRKEKIERIMYGSDLVDAVAFHGNYAPFGSAWFQVVTDGIKQLRFDHCEGRPVLCVYDNLLCLKYAADYAQLSSDDIEKFFWKNAAGLFGCDI